jgi:hypothetical protein
MQHRLSQVKEKGMHNQLLEQLHGPYLHSLA